MNKKGITFLIVILILFLIFGVFIYTYLESSQINYDNALDVPYVSQTHQFWCGPASLEMVLRFWGDNVTQKEIASIIYLEEKNVTLVVDMVNFAQRRGFSAFRCKANLTFIEEQILKSYPVIVLLLNHKSEFFDLWQPSKSLKSNNCTIVIHRT